MIKSLIGKNSIVTPNKTLIFREPEQTTLEKWVLLNTYSMKQPDLYYFEAIKMT